MDVVVIAKLSDQAVEKVKRAIVEVGGTPHFLARLDRGALDAGIRPRVIFGNPSVDFIQACEGLEWVHAVSAGIDQYSKEPDRIPERVVLTNSSGVYGAAGGEHILGMMLYFNRGLHHFRNMQLQSKWDRDLSHARLLRGETLCVVGLGDLGTNVVKRAQAFDMRILGVKRTPTPVDGVERVVSPDEIDEILPEVQHLAITLPLTAETRGMFDARRLNLLPWGAYLYNIGRGPIVDEQALIDALRSGRLKGAGLDVFDVEPLPKDHPFWQMENVLITPHLGADTPWDNDRAADLFVENLYRFSRGEPLSNRVSVVLGY